MKDADVSNSNQKALNHYSQRMNQVSERRVHPDYKNETSPAGVESIPNQPLTGSQESSEVIKEKDASQEAYEFGQKIECICANCGHMKLSHYYMIKGARELGKCIHQDGCLDFKEKND